MITKQQIKQMTSSRFYERGKQIYSTGWMIEKFSVGREDNLDLLEAAVEGSYGNSYFVSGVYDTETEEIVEIQCECPAYWEYDGICKHCVAVLLEYEDYCRRQKLLSEYVLNTGKKASPMLAPGRYGAQKTEGTRQRTTDREARELLESLSRQKQGHIREKDMEGTVELEPHLKLERDHAEVSFRIGRNQKYVVKDIFELAGDIKDHRAHSYGKKLDFIHNLETFTEKSRPLAEYILDWAEENRKYYMQKVYYRNFGRGSYMEKCKEISMDGYELERFFQVYPEDRIIVQEKGTEENWQIIRQEPGMKLHLTGKDGGLEIKLEIGQCFTGKNQRISFQNGKIFLIPRERDTPLEGLLECLEEKRQNTLFIQEKDLPVFCSAFLPEVSSYAKIRRKNFREEEYILPEAAFRFYLDMPRQDQISCRPVAVYGETDYNLLREDQEPSKRDLFHEAEIQEFLTPWFNAFDPKEEQLVLTGDEEKLLQFVTEGIEKLKELGEVFVSENLRKLKLHRTNSVTAGISLSGNLLELQVSADNFSRKELAEIFSAYRQKKKYYRLQDGEVLDLRDPKLQELYELLNDLGIREKDLEKPHIQLPGCRALYVEEQIECRTHLEVRENQELKEKVRAMDEDLEEERIPGDLDRILREYQKTGVKWLCRLKKCGFGGILADDMGLGKTLQVVAFLVIQYRKTGEEENCRTLIVTPASLVYNWLSELERFAPELPVRAVAGNARERETWIKNAGKREVLVTSYDLLKRDISFYRDLDFSCQILDEAQYIKNHSTQAARAVRRIRSQFRAALTGTPVENRLSELWSIFYYLMPGFFGLYPSFRRDFEQPIIRQDTQTARKLQKMVRPFILRRLKKDVLKDLPDKLEKNTYVKLEPEQQRIYDAHVQRLKMFMEKQNEEEFKNAKLQILAELTKLRQICCCPGLLYENYLPISAKESLCLELINNAAAGGHKVLLFSQFTTMLDQLCKRLDQGKIPYYLLTGSVSKEKRQEMVKVFQEDDTPVFCISLKAGGTGLNLTAADIVIHYDPWWNTAVQDQATDRAHRIGQENVVNVYRLVAKGTIEENIIRLQDQKRQLADSILSGDGMGSGTFDKAELLELLG